jgi:hypothetical protein
MKKTREEIPGEKATGDTESNSRQNCFAEDVSRINAAP